MLKYLNKAVRPDAKAFMSCITRTQEPERVHHCELFLDHEIKQEIAAKFSVWQDISPQTADMDLAQEAALQRFLGYDYVRGCLENVGHEFLRLEAQDTAELERAGGRHYQDEHSGPISDRASFDAYGWPDPDGPGVTRQLDWYEHHLDKDMCVLAQGGFGHFCEHLTWLFGYERLCFALYDDRSLVGAVAERLIDISKRALKRVLEYDRVTAIWASDDMGFISGTLISPDDMRAYVLPGHKVLAEMAHAAGKPYLLHSCGNLEAIMPDLMKDVGIDALHSFEDTIKDVRDLKKRYGSRLTLFGGIDVDFMCRAPETAIRQRVRDTLDVCQPGGGYCLGTGNSVANYIPVSNYLAMLDEGNRWSQDHR